MIFEKNSFEWNGALIDIGLVWGAGQVMVSLSGSGSGVENMGFIGCRENTQIGSEFLQS